MMFFLCFLFLWPEFIQRHSLYGFLAGFDYQNVASDGNPFRRFNFDILTFCTLKGLLIYLKFYQRYSQLPTVQTKSA